MTRLASVGDPGRETPAVVLGDRVVGIAELPGCGHLPEQLIDIIAGEHLATIRRALDRVATDAGVPLAEVRLGPPVVRPGKVVCVGLNYRDHATEQGKDWPAVPLLFAKAPSCLIGCTDPIRLPADGPDHVDYEVELAAVIGTGGRDIDTTDALEHVIGFTVVNDVTQRKWQRDDGQWFRAKSCDGFGPCGPWLVTRDEIADHRMLRLTTRIGDELLQDATVSDLIHDLPQLIAYISGAMRLDPGDLICTGTPAGVGCFRDPRRFLRPGDTVRCAIEGIGELVNPVERG